MTQAGGGAGKRAKTLSAPPRSPDSQLAAGFLEGP